jgi:hypothetical protein
MILAISLLESPLSEYCRANRLAFVATLMTPRKVATRDTANRLSLSGACGRLNRPLVKVGARLRPRLEKVRADRPALPGLREPGTVRVRPDLIAEIEQSGWTDNRLVPQSFKGLIRLAQNCAPRQSTFLRTREPSFICVI